jgi:hypothetical protein
MLCFDHDYQRTTKRKRPGGYRCELTYFLADEKTADIESGGNTGHAISILLDFTVF